MQYKEPTREHLQLLKEKFNHSSFKKEQWDIIRGVMYDKRDCCVIASTGFGKSLIYQFPPVFMDKLTIVISPLCALMQDQVLSLQDKNIKACFLGSQQSDKSLRMIDHNIVYITPEYFCNRKSEVRGVRDKIMMFAVDEAHVIDQWSDFRKDYQNLGQIREHFPGIPIVALTATAPQYVKDVIVESLKLKNEICVRTYLDRPNLEFSVMRKSSGYMTEVLPLLKNLKEGSAIVYCISREITEEISKNFNQAGIKSRPYHAGMKTSERKEIVREFRENTLRFVVCTIAYGMGIDKGDVRLVVHYGVPKSLEAYYQEAGRAGRDGKPSRCIMFYDFEDFQTVRGLINSNESTKKIYLQGLLSKVSEFVASTKCRRLGLLNYLGTTEEELKKITIRNSCCDNCKRDLLYNIPPQLQYLGLNTDGTFNFGDDVRILLKAVNPHLIRAEIIKLLLGELPSREISWCFKLEVFGLGQIKSKDWWNYLISLLVQNQFLHVVGNILKLDRKAKNFLRFKSTELNMKPSQQLLNFFEKRNDVELFWKNGVVASRSKLKPRTNSTLRASNQRSSRQRSVEDKLSSLKFDKTRQIEYLSSDEELGCTLQSRKLANPKPESFGGCTSHSKAIEYLFSRDIKDKMEIESLARINFEEDETDKLIYGESSRKREHDEDDGRNQPGSSKNARS